MPQGTKEKRKQRITHIRKGDTVYVLAGKDHEQRLAKLAPEETQSLSEQQLQAKANDLPGKRGRVIEVRPDQGKVIVDGVQMVTKHAKARGRTSRSAQLQTGRMSQPAPIDVSNVMLVCPHCNRPTRVTRAIVEGRRVRKCKQCGESIDLA